jgi:hypothetical protein
MENNIEVVNSQTDEDVITQDEPEVGLPVDPVEVEPKDEDTVDSEALKQRNQELYEQLKKAKGFQRDKVSGKWVKKEVKQQEQLVGVAVNPKGINLDEIYTLVKANVPSDDKDEAVLYARSHNMSVDAALKTEELKSILRIRADYRKSAEAANTANSRYGGHKPSEDQIMADVEKGILPDAETLANLTFKRRIGKK